MKERLRALWHAFSTFSDREGRRALLFVPLLAALSLLFLWLDEPRFDKGFTQYAGADDSGRRAKTEKYPVGRDERSASDVAVAASEIEERPEDGALFLFDPNTVTGAELERLGFTPKQAAVILRYRASGAVFRQPEDFARCYTVSDRAYRRLAPYIRISTASAEADARYVTGPEDRSLRVGDTAVVSDAVGASERFPSAGGPSGPVELNDADSAALTALRGIGPLTAGRIVRYRERLGGYVVAEQLREIEGMTERNFGLISQQIRVDSSKIRKIDINFAHPSAMKGHPYLTDRVLNRILKYRQLKGGWRSIEDLTEGHILTTEEAGRLGPYLCFEKK